MCTMLVIFCDYFVTGTDVTVTFMIWDKKPKKKGEKKKKKGKKEKKNQKEKEKGNKKKKKKRILPGTEQRPLRYWLWLRQTIVPWM